MNGPTTLTLERLAREHLSPDVPVEGGAGAARPFGAFNAVASFSNAEGARTALKAVEASGVQEDRQSLLLVGGTPVTAPDGGEAVGPDPEGVAGYTGRRILPGAVIGAVVGGGAVAAATALLGSFEAGEIIAASVGGAGLFAAVGGMIGAFSSFNDSDAFRSTFTDIREELALVAVHTDDRSEADAARRAFEQAGARRTWMFGPDGRAIGARGARR